MLHRNAHDSVQVRNVARWDMKMTSAMVQQSLWVRRQEGVHVAQIEG
jgi:hypothetical protein